MKMGHIAKLLNASTSTIRRWSDTYRAYFEVNIEPSDSFAPVFCERDLRVLLLVSQLRNEGVAHDDIAQRLKSIDRRTDTESMKEQNACCRIPAKPSKPAT